MTKLPEGWKLPEGEAAIGVVLAIHGALLQHGDAKTCEQAEGEAVSYLEAYAQKRAERLLAAAKRAEKFYSSCQNKAQDPKDCPACELRAAITEFQKGEQ